MIKGHGQPRIVGTAAVERIWHTLDSHSQIMALTFRSKCLNPFKLFTVRSEAGPWVASESRSRIGRGRLGGERERE